MTLEEIFQELSEHIKTPLGLSNIIRVALIELSESDPQKASELVHLIPVVHVRRRVHTHVAVKWADSDAPKAAIFAKKIDDPDTRDFAMSMIAERWARTDSELAVEFARNISTDKHREWALGKIASIVVTEHGVDAATLLLNQIQDSGRRKMAIEEVAEKEFASRPAFLALAWVSALKRHEMRSALMGIDNALRKEEEETA